jgi:hypothetical protein
MNQNHNSTQFEGARVLITDGNYRSCEGVCLGRAADGVRWAISPDDSAEILDLRFEKDFGLLVAHSPS